MLEAMMAAPVGDDVYGDDPTLMLWQTMQQSFPVKKPPFFCLPALRPTWSLCSVTANVAKSILSGQAAHNYLFEAGGAAVLGSIQPQPIDAAADGTLPLDKVAMKIKTRRYPFRPAPNYSVWKTPTTAKCCRVNT